MIEFLAFFSLEVKDIGDERFLQMVQTHAAEVFCPPRFTARASKFKLQPGISMDLRTGLHLNDSKYLQAAWRYLKEVKPYLLIGSPERDANNQLQLYKYSGTPDYCRRELSKQAVLARLQ